MKKNGFRALMLTLMMIVILALLFCAAFYVPKSLIIIIPVLFILYIFLMFYKQLDESEKKKKNQGQYNIYWQQKINSNDIDDSGVKTNDNINIIENELLTADPRDIIIMMRENNAEIKEYFTISKNQSKISYYLAIASCIIGIGLVIFAVILFHTKETIAESIIIAISGAITEVVAGTTLMIHNKSVIQLKDYYDALHENEKFLSAVKLIEYVSEEKRDDIYIDLIKNQVGINVDGSDKNLEKKEETKKDGKASEEKKDAP